MQKVSTTKLTPKELLKKRQREKLYSFLLADGKIRGAFVDATLMVNEMRWNFDLGVLETYVLGQAYIAAALLSANIQGNDRIALSIECSGPIKGITVEVTATGEVRGHLKNVPIPIEKPLDDFNLSPFFGAGFLTITKYLEDAKHPYEGKTPLMYGTLALDLADYFLTSEQTATAFTLSVQFSPEGEVIGAGGLFLQAMPGTDEELREALEKLVSTLPSIGREMSTGVTPEQFVKDRFASFTPQILGDKRVEFFCRCSHDQMRTYLAMLPKSDKEELFTQGPFPLELRCHNCNTRYHFSQEQLATIVDPTAKA